MFLLGEGWMREFRERNKVGNIDRGDSERHAVGVSRGGVLSGVVKEVGYQRI